MDKARDMVWKSAYIRMCQNQKKTQADRILSAIRSHMNIENVTTAEEADTLWLQEYLQRQ